MMRVRTPQNQNDDRTMEKIKLQWKGGKEIGKCSF